MVYWLSTVHHYDKSTFATEEVDKQLKEGVDRESLKA